MVSVVAVLDHWRNYAGRWGRIRPPLRPTAEVVAAIRAEVDDERVLLLGVTPELGTAFATLLAVDRNPEMIARWWPGDTPTRQVLCADWLTLSHEIGPFSAIVSDGALSNVVYPQETAVLLKQVRDLLRPGGRFACRLFERPDAPPGLELLAREAHYPMPHNFHAFKWRLAMSLAAAQGAALPVVELLKVFNRLFPDRQRLAEDTGWPRADIETIDVYAGSDLVYAFPSRAELLAQIPEGFLSPRFVPCGGYDLAENCPILVLEREGP